MRLPFELYIALRYLLARRRQAFISLISVISTVGVAVGVMALLIALALMTGLQQELRDRIVGSAGHIYVWKLGESGLAEYEVELEWDGESNDEKSDYGDSDAMLCDSEPGSESDSEPES